MKELFSLKIEKKILEFKIEFKIFFNLIENGNVDEFEMIYKIFKII